MATPGLPAITLNTCLLVGCAAIVATRGASHADEPVANPTGGGGTVQLEPAPERERPSRKRAVFVCRGAGPVVFSDLPCGPVLREHEVSLQLSSSAGGASATTTPAKPAAATRPLPEPALEIDTVASDPTARRCRRLREQLDKLDDRMRTGYPAREAARLWNRWRELKADIYAGRC
jgi:hypothetical protein